MISLVFICSENKISGLSQSSGVPVLNTFKSSNSLRSLPVMSSLSVSTFYKILVTSSIVTLDAFNNSLIGLYSNTPNLDRPNKLITVKVALSECLL